MTSRPHVPQRHPSSIARPRAGFGLCASAVAIAAFCGAAAAQEPRMLDAGIVHLGDTRIDGWAAGTPDPVGRVYERKFAARFNRDEHCLLFRHHDVDDPWHIEINGRPLPAAFGADGPARLVKGKELADHVYLLPRGTLKDGDNLIRVLPSKEGSVDDILIGAMRLVEAPLREHLQLRVMTVQVSTPRGGGGDDAVPVPARVTLRDPAGKVAPIFYVASPNATVRDGVVYTAGRAEPVQFEVPRGRYVVIASRGMEWGIDTRAVMTEDEGVTPVALTIRRELDTTGYIAADTHLHTVTFSGHGDATLEERVVTLAGDGVEFAVATDHNHQTDYAPTQSRLGLDAHYTAVVGNEVSSKNGHFNAFPMDPAQPVPAHRLTDWVKLIDGIRSRGAQVVVLNHPRWPQPATGPFGVQRFGLDRRSGRFAKGPDAVTWDAMELINSTLKVRDPLDIFVDWFALLNRGCRVMAVGTSDSHTVADATGQGRTYLVSGTDEPTAIDVEEVCQAMKAGRSSVAMGIFTEIWVEGEHRMGDLAKIEGDSLDVALRVACPSWVQIDRVGIYLNGSLVAERALQSAAGARPRPTDRRFTFELGRPAHDGHLIAIASGPAVQGTHWDFASMIRHHTLGATNPVWIDADGDGVYSSPAAQAESLLATVERRPLAERDDALRRALGRVDDAVAIQVAAILVQDRPEDAASQAQAKARVEALASSLHREALLSFAKSL